MMANGVPPMGSGHSSKDGAASCTASPAKPSVPNATTIGMPFPWVLKAHKEIGDRFFFFSVSPLTLAFGFEFLLDGFVLFLGPINIGWASISSFDKREAEERARFEAAIVAAARQGGDGTAPAESPQSGAESASPEQHRLSPSQPSKG